MLNVRCGDGRGRSGCRGCPFGVLPPAPSNAMGHQDPLMHLMHGCLRRSPGHSARGHAHHPHDHYSALRMYAPESKRGTSHLTLLLGGRATAAPDHHQLPTFAVGSPSNLPSGLFGYGRAGSSAWQPKTTWIAAPGLHYRAAEHLDHPCLPIMGIIWVWPLLPYIYVYISEVVEVLRQQQLLLSDHVRATRRQQLRNTPSSNRETDGPSQNQLRTRRHDGPHARPLQPHGTPHSSSRCTVPTGAVGGADARRSTTKKTPSTS